MGSFLLFQQARCELIAIYKYTNCNLLEHEWITTWIRTLEAQIDEKNKNIEARQNVAGSYKKGCNSNQKKRKRRRKKYSLYFFSELVQFNEIFRKIINELNVNNY